MLARSCFQFFLAWSSIASLAFSLTACSPSTTTPVHLVAQNTDRTYLYFITSQQPNTSTQGRYQLWGAVPAATLQFALLTDRLTYNLLPNAILTGMVWDDIHQQLIVGDAYNRVIYRIDPVSGATFILSGEQRGDGPEFGSLGAMVLDTTNQRLIVIDEQRDDMGMQRMLTQVDIASGNRRVLAGSGFGVGPLESAVGIAYAAQFNQFYVSYQTGILLINGYSGDRRVFSAARQGVGLGQGWLQAGPLALDYAGHRLLLTDGLDRQIVAISLATGDRKRVASWKQKSTKGQYWGQSTVLNKEALYIANQSARHLLQIKLNVAQSIDGNNDASEAIHSVAETQPDKLRLDQEFMCTLHVLELAHKQTLSDLSKNWLLLIFYPAVFPYYLWLSAFSAMLHPDNCFAQDASMPGLDFGIVFMTFAVLSIPAVGAFAILVVLLQLASLMGIVPAAGV